MNFIDAGVVAREDLAPGYFILRLGGCEALAGALPGQFVMVRGDWGRDPLLPRAISLLEARPDGMAAILVKTVGRGTALLSRATAGARLRVLGPLGTAFPAPDAARQDLLIAGGSGVPPVYLQAARAAAAGRADRVEVFLGGRTAQDLPYATGLERLGVSLHLTTDDGSRGQRGLVTAALERRLDEVGGRPRLMACGPDPMLHAVARIARLRELPCLVSLEAAMACGLGACLGCAVPARSRPFVYVCQDGPVFDAAEVYQ
ncbi:MAG: dihydroorotate dehydrogenase electron transfer subunit [Deltaproteobacteria bacterium]|nr:dihydroorotate dehydrogenase electron transfer subunit [Deltaproteobacteria bacterium]